MSDPHYEFLRFRDLKANGIVSSRYDLHMKIRHRGFPEPLKNGDHMQSPAFWRKADIHAWLDKRFPQQVEN